MRKKSHISLAKHVINMSDTQAFIKHKKAFYVGSILPDCKPSFITKRHEINGTFKFVTEKITNLTEGYEDIDQLSTMYFTKLGEVIHYIADYFTYPHNLEYLGSMKAHCVYEGELKHRLRNYISNLDDADIIRLSRLDVSKFTSVDDICRFIRMEHKRYINRGFHSVEEDCKYIVGICSRLVPAILHVCMIGM